MLVNEHRGLSFRSLEIMIFCVCLLWSSPPKLRVLIVNVLSSGVLRFLDVWGQRGSWMAGAGHIRLKIQKYLTFFVFLVVYQKISQFLLKTYSISDDLFW